MNEKEKIIKDLFGKTGNTFNIEQPFMCDYRYNIEIRENFYSNHNLIILDGNKVKFGIMYLLHQTVLFIQQDIH